MKSGCKWYDFQPLFVYPCFRRQQAAVLRLLNSMPDEFVIECFSAQIRFYRSVLFWLYLERRGFRFFGDVFHF